MNEQIFWNSIPISFQMFFYRLETGTSDPYVKFKLGNKVVHRSKTIYRDLQPVWDEDFTVNVEDATVPLQIRVSFNLVETSGQPFTDRPSGHKHFI